jgi:hypothetical protein
MNKKKKEELQKVPTRLLIASIKHDIRRELHKAAKSKRKK